MLIAETVQIDGWLLAVFFFVMFVFAVFVAAVVIGGCVAARRAGRGSTEATVLLALILGAEVMVVVAAISNAGVGWAVAAGLVIAVQAGFFFEARRRGA